MSVANPVQELLEFLKGPGIWCFDFLHFDFPFSTLYKVIAG
jgi:hypothetical protein